MVAPMETTTVEPSNDPMHEQNQRKDPQRERRLLAARPHALAQEIRIERRERNDHDGGEDCEIRPKARDGDRAGCCEHCGGRGDHEKGCLEVSREWHRLTLSSQTKRSGDTHGHPDGYYVTVSALNTA